ncbi:MAG: cytochrome c oxidase subunit 3 [Pseudonocardiaceae bacterium]
MTAHTAGHGRTTEIDRMPSVVLGVVLFVASEAVFFSVLFGAWFTVRSRSPVWPPSSIPHIDPTLGAIATAVLVLSSLAIYYARAAIRGGLADRMIRFLWQGLVLGAVALGLQGWHLTHVGFAVHDGGFGTVYWMTSVIDSAHVLGALIFGALVLARGYARKNTGTNDAIMQACAIFWHFVVIASIFTFIVLEVAT